jgi:GntR family transcriptional regulator
MTLDKGSNKLADASEAANVSGGSPIEFRLDAGSGLPTYLQLVQQVEHALRLGYLHVDDQLPTVRDVVASLAINPNTVLKAYRELESRGLATGRPGQGTFIRGTLGRADFPGLAGLRQGLQGWMDSADVVGLDEEGMAALFSSVLAERRARSVTEAGGVA